MVRWRVVIFEQSLYFYSRETSNCARVPKYSMSSYVSRNKLTFIINIYLIINSIGFSLQLVCVWIRESHWVCLEWTQTRTSSLNLTTLMSYLETMKRVRYRNQVTIWDPEMDPFYPPCENIQIYYQSNKYDPQSNILVYYSASF